MAKRTKVTYKTQSGKVTFLARKRRTSVKCMKAIDFRIVIASIGGFLIALSLFVNHPTNSDYVDYFIRLIQIIMGLFFILKARYFYDWF